MATLRRSSRAKMRLCIFASSCDLLPLAQSSERALLLKVRITGQCKQLAYIYQRVPRARPAHAYKGSSGSRRALRRAVVAAAAAFDRTKLQRMEGAWRGSCPLTIWAVRL